MGNEIGKETMERTRTEAFMVRVWCSGSQKRLPVQKGHREIVRGKWWQDSYSRGVESMERETTPNFWTLRW